MDPRPFSLFEEQAGQEFRHVASGESWGTTRELGLGHSSMKRYQWTRTVLLSPVLTQEENVVSVCLLGRPRLNLC